MKLGFAGTIMLTAASTSGSQVPSTIPSGSPLGAIPLRSAAPDQALLEAQRARLQAAARARANAQIVADASAATTTTASVDEGRLRATTPASNYGQTLDSAETTVRASSPYGSYYKIRTPWDRR